MNGDPMMRIGVLTTDFSLYFDVIRLLRQRNAPFIDLEPGIGFPRRRGVLISTAGEFCDIMEGGDAAVPDGHDLPGVREPWKGAVHFVLLTGEAPQPIATDVSGSELVSGPGSGQASCSGNGQVSGMESVECDIDPFIRPFVHQVQSAEEAVDVAINLASGRWRFHRLSIGIDPGEKPGVVVIGDEQVLYRRKVVFPEDVRAVVKHCISVYPAEEILVRIGHGAETFRNRIINTLLAANIPGMELQIVDERGTTRTKVEPDINAAENIARIPGASVHGEIDLMPTDGEIQDIQRRSRMEGSGTVTVSRVLAELVARGHITLEEAVQIQVNPKMAGYYFKKRGVPEWAQREFSDL